MTSGESVTEYVLGQFRSAYDKVIPRLPDEFITWPGKDEGKPIPPIVWYDENHIAK